MNVDWQAILVFFAGSVVGATLSSAGQIVASAMTKDKHRLEAKFVPFGLTGIPGSANPESSRGIVLKNTGDFVERDIDARLKLLCIVPNASNAVSLKMPELIKFRTKVVTEEHMRDVETEIEYWIEHLSPKEEVALDITAGGQILELHFSASTIDSVSRVHWSHPKHHLHYAEVMEHVYGPAIPPPEEEMSKSKSHIDGDRFA